MKSKRDQQIIESVWVQGYVPWAVKVDIGFAEIKREDERKARALAVELFKESEGLQRLAEEDMKGRSIDNFITHTAVDMGWKTGSLHTVRVPL